MAVDIRYPAAPRAAVVDDYFGIAVEDPFRPLEDGQSQAVTAWLRQQKKLCAAYLGEIGIRAALRAEFKESLNSTRYRPALVIGGKVYFWRKRPQDQLAALCCMKDDAEESVLDPNGFSDDGTVSLNFVTPSRDARYLAYGLSEAGSDWVTIRVRELETGRDLDDEIRWVRYNLPEWDHEGFYYSAFDPPDEKTALVASAQYQKVYHHRLGESQEQDRLVYSNPEKPRALVGAMVYPEQNAQFIVEYEGSSGGNRLLYRPLDGAAEAGWTQIGLTPKTEYSPVGYANGRLLLRTDLNAPNYRLVSVDPEDPAETNWLDVLPTGEEVLSNAVLTANAIAALYLHDASSQLRIYDFDGRLIDEPDLPGPATIFEAHAEPDSSILSFGYTTFTQPISVMHYDTADRSLSVVRRVTGGNPEVVTERLHAVSADGERIPMFVIHKKGIQLDGNNPAVFYAYGGFNIKLTPEYNSLRDSFLKRGGVFVVVNARGGGEFGQKWHKAAILEKKQNTFNDFIAAAELLIDLNYTRPEHMAMMGGSNGGLLVGAVMTQRPELFAAAVPIVGVFDMLRYDKFTIGWAWRTEYGSSENEEQFHALRAYSPLHNVRPEVDYPATLIMTANHDDRVVPSHSYKFAATLQAAQPPNPVILRVGDRAGHGAGRPIDKIIADESDYWSFIMHHLGMDGQV